VTAGGREALVTSVVAGRVAAGELRAHPERLPEVVGRVAGWLERWHGATLTRRALTPSRISAEVLAPARRLAPLWPLGAAYRDWLSARAQAASGASLPWVAAHNDLTMDNILLTRHGDLGVVDWEMGEPEGWPLADFAYALTDAVMIAGSCADRLEAYRACFTPAGQWARLAAQWRARLEAAVALPRPLAELSWQAMWLRHAANEHCASPDGGPRPFLAIVQWNAAQALNGESGRG
jgi:Ser/Thr protein kinase RdoA (MazF antagonist)